MIEQPARIIEVTTDHVVVRTEMQGGCQSCGTKGGCGTSLISQLFPERPRQELRLPPDGFPNPPKVGDLVRIGIPERYLQQTSLLLYALPLLGLIGGALLGVWLAGYGPGVNSDPASMVGGGLGLAISLWLTSRWAVARERLFHQAIKVLRQTSSGTLGVLVDAPRSGERFPGLPGS